MEKIIFHIDINSCWDIDTKIVKNGDEVTDIAQQKRTLKIVSPESTNDHTRYFLDNIV